MATKVKLIADSIITTDQLDLTSLDSHFTGGTGVSYSSGTISIGQAVATTDNVTFADLTVTGNLNITGDINSYNVTDLDVTDKTITLGAGQIESNSGGSGIIVDGSSASILWDEANDVFDINKGLTAAGNVGIGTSNPDTLLHLNAVQAGPVLRLSRQDGSVLANDSLGKIEFYTTDVTNTGVAGYIDVQAEGGAAGGSMIFGTGTAGSADEKVRIAANGSVGIGTDSPGARLHAYTTGYPVAKFERYGSSTATRGWTQLGNSSLGYSGATGADTYIIAQHGIGLAVNEVTTAMTITDGANVGIGTTNPGSKLQIQTSHTETDVTGANSNSTLNIANSGVGNGVYNAIKFAANQQDMYIMSFNNSQQADRRLGFFLGSVAGDAATDERLSIRGNGNVGIGETSPDKQLHIKNNSTGDTGIVIENTNNAQNLDIDFYNNAGSAQGRIRYAEGAGSFGFAPNVSADDALHILYNGNVGIGTDAPAAPLHVKSTGHAHIFEGTGGNVSLKLQRSDASGAVDFGDIQFVNNTGIAAKINSRGEGSASGNLTFQTRNTSGTLTERMRIDSSGNVVIQDDVTYTANAPTHRGSLILAGASGFTNYGGLEFHTSSGGGAGYGTRVVSSDATMFFGRRFNATGWTESMRIDNNGRVGIGTNPSGSLHLTTVDSGGADVHYVAQNTISNRIAGYKILDENGNNYVSLTYDNGGNRGNLNLGQAAGEILYVYGGSTIKSGFGIDLSGSSRELSIFHTSSGTDGNIALGKRLESNGTFYETVQITPDGGAGAANLIVHNVNSNSFNHVQENKVPNLTAGEDVFLGLGKSTNTKNMGYLGYEWNASGSDSNYIHLSHWGADGLFRVYGNGNYSFAGSNVSDRDLKENIISVTDTALDKITQLEVRKFNFIKDYEVSSDGGEVETPRTQVGFIAQEVEAIIPDITVGTNGEKDMGVDTVGLVGYLTKAIQELKTELDAAKARITELEV